jgi:capsular exopolysaccharide synthesis family protein
MRKKSKACEQSLISQQNMKSVVAEAYRTLRTNMGFTEVDRLCRTILITSSHLEEGKSTTSANLAIVVAQAGQKVLLVDCDLRKPMQHRIFNVSNLMGLTSCLCQRQPLQEAVQPGPVENLDILTAGPLPPNPSEILSSEHTRAFWAGLKNRYDYILVDSPPVLAVADASILSSQVDGVLLVVNSGTTRVDHAKEAKEQLTKANAHIIGVVLNQFKIAKGKYQYYHYSSEASG